MVNASFGRTTQSYVPQDHLPPVSNYCLPLCVLCSCQVPALAFSVLNEGLDTHCWTILFNIFVVRIHFRIGGQLHHVSNQVWIGIQDQFRDEDDYLIFEGLFLVCGSIVVIQVDSNINVEWLDNVRVIYVFFCSTLEPTKNSN